MEGTRGPTDPSCSIHTYGIGASTEGTNIPCTKNPTSAVNPMGGHAGCGNDVAQP